MIIGFINSIYIEQYPTWGNGGCDECGKMYSYIFLDVGLEKPAEGRDTMT
jgi:hypothetical protein